MHLYVIGEVPCSSSLYAIGHYFNKWITPERSSDWLKDLTEAKQTSRTVNPTVSRHLLNPDPPIGLPGREATCFTYVEL